MQFLRCCIPIVFALLVGHVKAQANFGLTLADSALVLTKTSVVYDPAYRSIAYPMGDVPENTGVCTDVVIRAYRKLGMDLQQLVHEDMRAHFSLYPNKWGLSRPDKNIDHRRVPNLMVFFERFGTALPISNNPAHFLPGDIVCWQLDRGMTHIGVVSNLKSNDRKRHLIIHNIGAGQVTEDMLFRFPIIGHYRYGAFE
ncbi:MAG: DUF1287 domain-containing protein [Crocinitomicaceae bacterium]|nr:DUF1287 domain-containing protein [Crocinitomicaceae bacterium]